MDVTPRLGYQKMLLLPVLPSLSVSLSYSLSATCLYPPSEGSQSPCCGKELRSLANNQ